jgi:two-component system, LytTR family, sensor kinase
MKLTSQIRQLVKVAGIINLLLLLLCIALTQFLGAGLDQNHLITKKILEFMLANSCCWIVNLGILIFLFPLLSTWTGSKWLSFYLPSILLTFALAILIANSAFYHPLSDEGPGEPLRHPITGPLFFIVSINTLSLVAIELILSRHAASAIRIENANMKAENAELRMKSLQAEHEKLKNQLHPHFLFNSLTALKSLIRKDPGLAESYVVKLSGFLRFSISHNEQNVVPLEEELKFSLSYLEMQKIRFREALSYTVDIPGHQLAHSSLPVFSLQLTLENAIKHNRLTPEQPLSIVIRYIDPDWLLVENNIQEKLSTDSASGIGLKNLSDRYKLLIQEDIKVENDTDRFRVYLKIIRK